MNNERDREEAKEKEEENDDNKKNKDDEVGINEYCPLQDRRARMTSGHAVVLPRNCTYTVSTDMSTVKRMQSHSNMHTHAITCLNEAVLVALC